MTGWMTTDIVIYVVAAYLATGGLLKLIAARRASLLAEYEAEIAKEQAAHANNLQQAHANAH